MDPLTQGVLGSSLPQAVASPRYQRIAAVVGFLAGLLPDADVLIQSSTDPLLYLEYHRQFTHSLIFIPFGGCIVAAICFPFVKSKISFLRLFIFASLGYGTHGLLDACTTYGTQLFWPFSNMRVAWNAVSIIDPLFTLPLIVTVAVSFLTQNRRWASFGLGWGIVYLALGALQHQRAINEARNIAEDRGHQVLRIDAKPSFANILLWKTIYETDSRFYVDAVRILGSSKVFEGESLEKFVLERDFPELNPSSQQAKDIERFRWFSNGYIAMYPGIPNVVGDVRYSIVPNEIEPLWGIVVDPSLPESHVKFENFRDIGGRHRFLEMLGLGQYKQKPKIDSQ